MSAETECYTALSIAPAVTGMTGDRIYPDFVPDDKMLPAIAMTRMSTEFVNTIHTSSAVASKVLLEVWCMGSTRSTSEQLGDAAMVALAAGGFVAQDRRPEFDIETETFAAVISVVNWQ
jgi:hypothetical protein